MTKKGMIITSLLYAILVLFILILFTIILTISIRKNLIDTISDKIAEEVDHIAPNIEGLTVLPVFTGQTFTASDYAAGLIATDNVDGDVTDSISCTMPVSTINCTAVDASGNLSATFTRTTTEVTVLAYSYFGSYKLFTAAHSGTYKIELWGAQGGSNYKALGGKGAYTAGNIYLTGGQNLYIYVGSSPSALAAGWNGGGTGYSGNNRGGGGATDVRLVSGTWDDLASLRSRIMVAAGGGGASLYSAGAYGGAAGGLTGLSGQQDGAGTYTVAQGGSIASGGLGGVGASTGNVGLFGIGGNANSTTGASGGGGGGYYGGGSGASTATSTGSGAGGSSYISGLTGMNSINEDGQHIGSIYHYSGLYFNSIVMAAGDASMPTQAGTATQIGNVAAGYAKITWISN